jgi:hypothetical protein
MSATHPILAPVVAAEGALASAHAALLAAYVAQAPAFDAHRATFPSAAKAAKDLGVTGATYARWSAAFGFVTDVADAHGEDVLALIVDAETAASLRSFDRVTLVQEAGERLARANDPIAHAAAALKPLREAREERNATRRTPKPAKARTVTTVDTLSPVAFLAETTRQARAVLAAVAAGRATVSDDECAEIVAYAADLGPLLAQIVTLAGSEEAPTLGTVATV